MADKEWGAKVFAGDPTANKELHNLTAMVATGAGADTIAVAMTGSPVYMPTTDMAMMAHTTAMFRELGIRDEVIREFFQGDGISPEWYEATVNWKKEHMGDLEWQKKFLSGDVKAAQQMMLANSIIVNGVKKSAA